MGGVGAALTVDAVDLENVLGEINANGANLHVERASSTPSFSTNSACFGRRSMSALPRLARATRPISRDWAKLGHLKEELDAARKGNSARSRGGT
jgi:hypothetical protein